MKDVNDEIIQGNFYEHELVKLVKTNWTRKYERTFLKIPNGVISTTCQIERLPSPQDMTASGSAEFTLNLISNASMEKIPGNKCRVSLHSTHTCDSLRGLVGGFAGDFLAGNGSQSN